MTTTPSKTEVIEGLRELQACATARLAEHKCERCDGMKVSPCADFYLAVVAKDRAESAITLLDQPAADTDADPVDPNAPKVTGSPDSIWLVYGDLDEDAKHDEFDEVTWCGSRVGNADVRYVCADLASRASSSQPSLFEVEVERLRESGVSISEIVRALVAYAGPLDDPAIGWQGRYPSRLELFQCEKCGAEHEDCTKVPHEPHCSAVGLLRVMGALKKYKESIQ